jgi:hypothetical protein
MNKKLSTLLAIAILVSSLAACQSVTGTDAAANKGDSQLERKIVTTSTPLPSSASKQNEAAQLPQNGERIQKQLKNKAGTVELTIDAQVVRQDNNTFPAVKIVPQKFSQQQADSIIAALVGNQKFYSATQLSRESINKQIIFYKQRLEKTPESNKEKQDLYKSFIKEYEAMLATAVPKADFGSATRKFSKSDSSQYSESIDGKFQKNGHEYVLTIGNSQDNKQSDAAMHMVGPNTYSKMDRVSSNAANSKVKIPYSQALQQAQQLVKDMQSDLTLEDSFEVAVLDPPEAGGTGEKGYYYQFIFTREVNGFHMVYDTADQISSLKEEENNKSPAPWPYEYLSITINEDGVQDLNWVGPSKVEELLNNNVTMLKFSDVMNVFSQMIFVKHKAWEDTVQYNKDYKKAVITIDRITLGLARVQSGKQFFLIPVWDFYGTEDYIMADGTSASKQNGNTDDSGMMRDSLTSFLTINAVDGTVIDRNLGY